MTYIDYFRSWTVVEMNPAEIQKNRNVRYCRIVHILHYSSHITSYYGQSVKNGILQEKRECESVSFLAASMIIQI